MLQISELITSGNCSMGSNGQETIECFVRSDDPITDNADDRSTVLKFALPYFGVISELGNVFSDFNLERMGGEGLWKVTATYKSSTGTRAGQDASFSFTIGGGTQHITHSRKTIGTYGMIDPATKARKKAPNFNGAINVSGDGPNRKVDGIDIPVSSFDFKTTFYLQPPDMSEAFVEELKNSASSVNSDQVMIKVDGIKQTFLPGELLLVGAEGQKRIGFGDWELSLNWSSKRNRVDVFSDSPDLKKRFGVIAQNGWDYLWTYAEGMEVDAESSSLTPNATAVFVEQIFDYVPMTLILPTPLFGLDNLFAWTGVPSFPGGGFKPVLSDFTS